MQIKKLSYQEILELDEVTFVDVSLQKEFQNGHIKGSINLNPKNLVKYGDRLVTASEAIVLVTVQAEAAEIVELAATSDFKNIRGYLLIEDVPSERLVTSPMISVEELMNETKDYVLLDVRDPATITRQAPEKNLLNIPIAHLKERLNELDSTRPIYTLCGSGNSATSAASYLQKLGYDARVVAGGMRAVESFNTEEN